ATLVFHMELFCLTGIRSVNYRYSRAPCGPPGFHPGNGSRGSQPVSSLGRPAAVAAASCWPRCITRGGTARRLRAPPRQQPDGGGDAGDHADAEADERQPDQTQHDKSVRAEAETLSPALRGMMGGEIREIGEARAQADDDAAQGAEKQARGAARNCAGPQP